MDYFYGQSDAYFYVSTWLNGQTLFLEVSERMSLEEVCIWIQ